MSRARCVLSRRGADRLASLEAAIMSRAEEINTTDTVCPFEMVRDRLCVAEIGDGEGDGEPV